MISENVKMCYFNKNKLFENVRKLKNSLVNPLFNPKLGYIILYVTNRCNFRCDFASIAEIDKGRKPTELTLDEIDKITKSAGRLVQLS